MKYNRIQQYFVGGGLCTISVICIAAVITHWESSEGIKGLALAFVPGLLGLAVIGILQLGIRRDDETARERARQIGDLALALFDYPAKVYSGNEELTVVAVGESNGTKLRLAIERGYSEVLIDVQGISELDEAVLTTPARKRIELTDRGLILRGPPNLDDARARRDLLLEVRDELQQLATRNALPGKSGYR